MTFWDRYEKLCVANGCKPGSEQAAQALGTNRGTISAWKTSGKPPKTEFLTEIANVYGVSTDYLLGRTDDPTDYTRLAAIEDRKTTAIKQAVGDEATPTGITLYMQLDDADKCKVEGFIQGLLSQEKYTMQLSGKMKRA